MSNPAKIREAMEAAHTLMKNGIEFVPVPVFSDEERVQAAMQAAENLQRAMDENE